MSDQTKDQVQVVDIPVDINALFAAIRRYAQQKHISMLELVAEHLIDDLPFSVGYAIKAVLEESKPQLKPEEVTFEGLFASGRSDIAERMEEIIYDTKLGKDT